ncbi:PREDICTED: myelin transcription factor 1-like protein [Ipomoea nil]|uniref:myelin transcription factor 1-like protein n=1 Tax=Ipomoea nil TaxID=35883 RepID=UPI00090154CF|nr:PREDICTED: myelin transcription factor 1-like protein [Ipomoea nil]
MKTELEKMHQNDLECSSSKTKKDGLSVEPIAEEEKDDDEDHMKDDKDSKNEEDKDEQEDDDGDDDDDDKDDPANGGIVVAHATTMESEEDSEPHADQHETSHSEHGNPSNEKNNLSLKSASDSNTNASLSPKHDDSERKEKGVQVVGPIELTQSEVDTILSLLRKMDEEHRVRCKWLKETRKHNNQMLNDLSANVAHVMEKLSTVQTSQESPRLSQQKQLLENIIKEQHSIKASHFVLKERVDLLCMKIDTVHDKMFTMADYQL